MKFTHFFIIGAQRSGTTYMAEILNQHPDLTMAKPLRPEPKYFLDIKKKNNFNYQEYLKLFFLHKKNEKILGEKSTSYLENIKSAKNIKKVIEKFKIIIILRNPVYRAISHYNFSKKNKLENLDLETAIKIEKKRSNIWKKKNDKKISSNPFSYIESGRYIKYVTKWEKLVGKKNMIILMSEDLFGNIKMFQKVFKDLNIDRKFVPKKINSKYNNLTYDRDNNLSDKFYLKLSNKFKKSNELLKKRYKININKWTV